MYSLSGHYGNPTFYSQAVPEEKCLTFKRLRWSRGSVLAFGIQVRDIFRAKKSSALLPLEGK
jgi:hypothetical protein